MRVKTLALTFRFNSCMNSVGGALPPGTADRLSPGLVD